MRLVCGFLSENMHDGVDKHSLPFSSRTHRLSGLFFTP